MTHKVLTYLLYEGRAEEAINFTPVFSPGLEITEMNRHGEGDHKGKVMMARFQLHGHEFMAIDSPTPHNFTFTPAISLFVECESEQELDGIFEKLSDGGRVLMPLDNYGFSQRFGWTEDRFGVSWQLNLAG